MGFRYSKRVGGSRGWGLNFSGSGVSSSYRSKYGSVGSTGFSIRTGIPGLSFRGSWGRGKNKGPVALVILAIFATLFVAYIGAIILYNLARLIWWISLELYHTSLQFYHKWKGNREFSRDYYSFDKEDKLSKSLPESGHNNIYEDDEFI